MTHSFLLRILGICAQIDCEDAAGSALLQRVYGPLRVFAPAPPSLHYQIRARGDGYQLLCQGCRPVFPVDSGDLLYHFDKDLTLELQRRLPALYFLHAAAVAAAGEAVLLVAGSGSGKSTTCWGALHRGFSYLSDELAPVEPQTLRVHAYPRAICLKQAPPAPYALPPRVIRTPRSFHVAPAQLPSPVLCSPVPLGAIVFVRYRPDVATPELQRLSAAEGAARLYANALNQLSHAEAGLPAAIQICRDRPCYFLHSGDLEQTASLLARRFGAELGTAA